MDDGIPRTQFPPTAVLVKHFRELFEKHGARDSVKFRRWSEHRMSLLKDFHISGDVERLVAAGVSIQTLAVATLLINIAPGLDLYLKKNFGDRKTRQKKVQALTAAIPILREFQEGLKTVEVGEPPSKFLEEFKFPSPSTMISGLEYYGIMLTAGDLIFEFLDVNSLLEIAKYSFARAVREITDKYFDREVSALTGAALQNFEYDETAHRVWRIRNVPRLSASKAGFMSQLLTCLNQVITSKPK